MSPTHALARSILAKQYIRPVTSISIFNRTSRGSISSIMAPQKRKQSSYTEDWSKGAMLRFEDSLPKLPVPSLQETSDRYLKSVRPLLNDQEYSNTAKAVQEFVKSGGQGEELQKRLEARRDDPQHKNWIYEWWNSVAYLGMSVTPERGQ